MYYILGLMPFKKKTQIQKHSFLNASNFDHCVTLNNIFKISFPNQIKKSIFNNKLSFK